MAACIHYISDVTVELLGQFNSQPLNIRSGAGGGYTAWSANNDHYPQLYQ